MSETVEDIFNHTWKEGWQLDLEYILPRVVFHKGSGTCYMYSLKDFDDHLRTCELTNLEYLEGRLFYREHCMQLLQKRMTDRLVEGRKIVSFKTYGYDGINLEVTTIIKGDK
jgi:hypothetical protein